MKTNKMKVVHQSENVVSEKTAEASVEALYEILKELPKPEASMKLTSSQKKWWFWFGYEFIKTNQFSKLDLVHLQNAAISMDARCKLIKIINEENEKSKNGVGGWVQRFASGATNVTGYQTMYEKATKQLDDVSAHFGLSIRDRKKLSSAEQSDDKQLRLFDDVLKKLD